MSRLLIGNYDFEWSLSHPETALPAHLRRLADELAFTWLAIAEADDTVLLPSGIEREHWDQLTDQLPWSLPRSCADLRTADRTSIPAPWGWSQRLTEDCGQAGRTLPSHPSLEVVRQVNSREFSGALECDLGCELPEARVLTTLEEVRTLLQAYAARRGPDARWVIKANFSNSSRERLLGTSPELSARDQTWLESRLGLGKVAFEPWLEIVAEAGLQWEVPASGDPVLLGVVPQLTDAAGHYRGSLFGVAADIDARWNDAIDATRLAARRIQAAGYFGPLGIDACRYRATDGEIRLRPLQDINARWTMGRLSLGWRRLLGPGEVGVWMHGPVGAVLREGTLLPLSAPRRIIETSPTQLGGQPCRLQHRVEIYST